MADKDFSIGDALQFGWDTMKSNIGFFIGLLIIVFLIQVISNALVKPFKDHMSIIGIILSLAAMVIGILIQMGLMNISLLFCDGVKGQLKDLFSKAYLVTSFIGGSMLYFLIVLGGLILLIIPGVIWGVKFSLFGYFIIDKEMGPVEALKASGKATDGVKWKLFLFELLLGLINLAGALLVLIGLFATIPTTMVASARVYRELASGIKDAQRVMYVSPSI